MDAIADELIQLVDAAASDLRALDAAIVAAKRAPYVWSVKEIIGHLVDSAANNHQRFIRAQIEGSLTFPGYQQNDWVRLEDHQGRDWHELVSFWQAYNHQLAHVIRRIPADRLGAACTIGTGAPVTLGFLVEDYLLHLRHHLKQAEERRNGQSM
jgi:hypothetical protein